MTRKDSDTPSEPDFLKVLVCNKLAHLDLRHQIEDVKQVVGVIGSSCDLYTGLWRSGDSPRGSVKVAIKKLRFYCYEEPVIAKRLAKEVYIWSRLWHQNVLPLVGFFVDDNGQFPHLVSEWMANGTLFQYLKVLEPGAETIKMAGGIAAGLSYLHHQGVVHADLKSQNILISDSNQPLIADFGVSHIMAASMTMMCGTSSRSPKGTARWTAVELFGFGEEESGMSIPTQESDVWAFGMVIYELLSRKLPFENLKHEFRVIGAILSNALPEFPDIDRTVTGVQELWWICERCWFKDPRMRPSLDSLILELERALPVIFDRLDDVAFKLSHLSLSVALVPSRADWFALMNIEIEPEKQLLVDLLYSFMDDNLCPRNICFSEDGRFFAGKLSQNIVVVDVETGIIKSIDYRSFTYESSQFEVDPWSEEAAFQSVCLSSDGTLMAIGYHHGMLVCDLKAKHIIYNFKHLSGATSLLKFSRDARSLFSFSWLHFSWLHDRFHKWDLETGVQELDIDLTRGWGSSSPHCLLSIRSIALSADDMLVAAGSEQGAICVWNAVSGELLDQLVGHMHRVDGVIFTPDGDGLISWSREEKRGGLRTWDISALRSESRERSRLRSRNAGKSRSKCKSSRDWGNVEQLKGEVCTISPDGRWVIVKRDNRLFFWDDRLVRAHLMLQGHSDDVDLLAMSSRGNLFVTQSRRKWDNIRIWKYSTLF